MSPDPVLEFKPEDYPEQYKRFLSSRIDVGDIVEHDTSYATFLVSNCEASGPHVLYAVEGEDGEIVEGHIEVVEPDAASAKPRYMLVIANQDWLTEDLQSIEPYLFDWLMGECRS